jgi:hypothetical protein
VAIIFGIPTRYLVKLEIKVSPRASEGL